MNATNLDKPPFGASAVEPERILDFPRGLAGFENCKRFALFHPQGDNPPHYILQSLDDPAVAFNIVDPARFEFGYELVLSDDEVADLAITDGARRVSASSTCLAVMVMLSKDGPGQPLRANLNGPLIINLDSRRGLQHVFERLDYKLNPV